MALNSATIKSIQDMMRKDAGVDGDAQRLGQLTWLLFLRIFDDREQEWEITVKKYRSPIPEELRFHRSPSKSESSPKSRSCCPCATPWKPNSPGPNPPALNSFPLLCITC